MIISLLEATNFRSYKSQVIDLAPGINVLVGASGAGKSNLLRLIGHTLFNWSDRAQKDLVRRGSPSGSVRINLADGLSVSRSYGTAPSWTLYGPGGEVMAEGVRNVAPALAEYLNAPEPLDHTFANLICVRQLRVHEGFDDPPSERKRRFDAVIGVNRYEQMWSKMAPVEGQIVENINRLKYNRATFEGKLAVLSSQIGDVETLESEITNMSNTISGLSDDLAGARSMGDDDDLAELEIARRDLSTGIAVQRTEKKAKLDAIDHRLALIRAGKCPTCGTSLEGDDWQKELQELEEEAGRIKGARISSQPIDALSADIDRLKASLARASDIERQLAKLKPALAAARDDLARQTALAQELAGVQAEVAKLDERISGMIEVHKRAIAIRQAVRLAGPVVGRRLVSTISAQANQIFSEATGGELEWQPDYGVRLNLAGVDHGFDGSDGQKVLASLAIRLGMAKVLNRTGLLCLDEVTMGAIDPDLAQLIPQMVLSLGMEQVICIDHGNLFDAVASNIIEVRNEDGESKVG